LNYKLIFSASQLEALGWATFVEAHAGGSVFQSPGMHELFSGTRRMKPVVVGVAETGSGLLRGVLLGVNIRELPGPAGYFSSRTVIYGGPLIDPEAHDRNVVLGLLLDGLISRVKRHTIFIQFRNFFSQDEFKEVYRARGFYFRERLNLVVDTTGMEQVVKSMSASRWRQIRKGLALGAKCIIPENTDQVREFYAILVDLYKHKVKKPLPAWDFFEQFYAMTKDGKLGKIFLVEYKGRIIGGILSPVTPGRMIFEWYVCGLDHEYREVHPSVLATWAAIDYAVKHKVPGFDFMGVGIPGREYGVREFKARFGGKMVNYGRFARVNNRLFYMISEMGYNILTLLKKI
jgi:serine/alanine adding enzyme